MNIFKEYLTTKYGILSIEADDEAILSINFLPAGKSTDEYAQSNIFTELCVMQLKEYFSGDRRYFNFPYRLTGTDFQNEVWTEIAKIPYGETRSYKQIAEAIGNPKAVRAVGMANNRNPWLVVVPCHRVIGANGQLVGYAGGLDKKEFLLRLENPNFSLR